MFKFTLLKRLTFLDVGSKFRLHNLFSDRLRVSRTGVAIWNFEFRVTLFTEWMDPDEILFNADNGRKVYDSSSPAVPPRRNAFDLEMDLRSWHGVEVRQSSGASQMDTSSPVSRLIPVSVMVVKLWSGFTEDRRRIDFRIRFAISEVDKFEMCFVRVGWPDAFECFAGRTDNRSVSEFDRFSDRLMIGAPKIIKLKSGSD